MPSLQTILRGQRRRDIAAVNNRLWRAPPLNVCGARTGDLPDYERGITAPFHRLPLALHP